MVAESGRERGRADYKIENSEGKRKKALKPLSVSV